MWSEGLLVANNCWGHRQYFILYHRKIRERCTLTNHLSPIVLQKLPRELVFATVQLRSSSEMWRRVTGWHVTQWLNIQASTCSGIFHFDISIPEEETIKLSRNVGHQSPSKVAQRTPQAKSLTSSLNFHSNGVLVLPLVSSGYRHIIFRTVKLASRFSVCVFEYSSHSLWIHARWRLLFGVACDDNVETSKATASYFTQLHNPTPV